MPERGSMAARERRLREDNISAASMLRAAFDGAMHIQDRNRVYCVALPIDTLNRILATLEGWEYTPEDEAA